MALLTALALHPLLRTRVLVGHVDHGLRAESAAECEFVREQCRVLNIPVESTRLRIKPDAPGNLADRLRRARYEYLQSLVPADGFLLTAHHADDQAVTMLMRLLEGAGLPGLAGIPVRRGNIVRPLLSLSRRQLQSFLREQEVDWCEDTANEDESGFRNRVRRRIWSPMVSEQPAAPPLIADVARRLREDDDALQQWAQRLLQDARAGFQWVEVGLPDERVPPAVIRRLLQLVMDLKWPSRPISYTLWAEVASNLPTGRRLNLPGRVTVHNKKNVLIFEHERPPSAYRIEVAGPGDYRLPTGTLVVHGTTFPLVVRSWRPGDRSPTGQRLPDWLARHGIPGHRRTGWPVMTTAAADAPIIAVATPASESPPVQADYVFEDVLSKPFQG